MMTYKNLYRAIVFVATYAGGTAGHEVGDYPVQNDCDAQRKQGQAFPQQPINDEDDRSPEQRVRDGWAALTRHGLTYGTAQLASKLLAYRAAGVHVPFSAALAGQLAETGLHMVIDDGRLLLALADKTGKRRFHDLAAGGVNGRMLLDQALHKGVQIPLGATITAALAAVRVR